MVLRGMFKTVVIVLLFLYVDNVHGGEVKVETKLGTIIGSELKTKVRNVNYTVKTFFGIPYAKPPTGERRFVKPEPVSAFDSPFEALRFRSACAQPSFPGFPQFNDTSEDCLYLNMYVPDRKPDKPAGHAVMVFIHGGGLLTGAAHMYPGENLCSYGNVIVVTINYRLGLFGFLDSTDGRITGNLGFHDQHMAFKWVNKNIGAFGGDKDRVTIFGQSAGASSVLFQGMYTENKGLIHRVIAESGVLTAASLIQQTPKETCLLLSKELGCDDVDTDKAVKCMRQITTKTIMEKLEELSVDPEKQMLIQLVPTVDGDIVKVNPKELRQLVKDGKLEQVEFFRTLDLITGFTRFEGGVLLLTQIIPVEDIETFSVSREDFVTKAVPTIMAMNQIPDVVKSLVIAEYTSWDNPDSPIHNRDQYVKLMGDSLFTIGSLEMSQLHSNISERVPNSYTFWFTAKPVNHAMNLPSWMKGASHGDELPFVFIFPDGFIETLSIDKEVKPTADWEYELAYSVATYWTNFAKSGNPNKPVDISPEWPKYDLAEQRYINIQQEMTESSTGKYFYTREANLWLETIPEVIQAVSHDHDPSSPFVKKSEQQSCSADGSCGDD